MGVKSAVEMARFSGSVRARFSVGIYFDNATLQMLRADDSESR